MTKSTSNLKVPEDKDFVDFTYSERRAYIWQLFLERGPGGVSNKELAKKFGVSSSQITHDKKVLGEWAKENLEGDFAFYTKLGLEKALRELYDNDWAEYRRWLQFLWKLVPGGLDGSVLNDIEEEAKQRGFVPKKDAISVNIAPLKEDSDV